MHTPRARRARGVDRLYNSSRARNHELPIYPFSLRCDPGRALCNLLRFIWRSVPRDTPEGSAITNMPTETLWESAVSGSARPPRHLLIISRYHPGLYDYVRARFADEDHVEVVLDRRRGRDRRASAVEADVERRSADRRVRPDIDAALRMESMQFVTIASGTMRTVSRPDSSGASDRSV